MAEYTPVPTRAWSSVVFAQNGDGTGTFWANTMLPWWNRFHTVATYLAESGTVPATGVSLDTQGVDPDDADGLTLLGCSGRTGAPGALGAPGTLREHYDAIVDGLGDSELAYHEPVTLNDADQTVTVTRTANRRLTVPSVTANRNYTIANPTTDGMSCAISMVVAAGVTTNLALIKNAGGTTLITLGINENYEWARLVATGGAWVVFERGLKAPPL